MGINHKKRVSDGKSVEIYLNNEMKRAYNEWRQQEEEGGREPLSEKQFAKIAFVEKIKRELGLDIRSALRTNRRDTTYHVSDEGELDVQSED